MQNPRRLRPALLLAALCAAAAPALHAEIATWTNLDGQAMQAEFLGRKGDYVSFAKTDGTKYLYPYAKLSEPDRARIDTLASKTPAVDDPAPADPAKTSPAPAPAKVGEMASALAGKLVAIKGSSLQSTPRDQLVGARHLALYYSAHWCPPCRAFTPELVEAYQAIKAKNPDFEIVFVSSDEDADAMRDYMKEYKMAWPALRFDAKKSIREVKRPAHERGIPNLVFMDADGKTLSVSYTPEGKYRGPRAVLADIKKHYKM
jgi:nucleoredoxin